MKELKEYEDHFKDKMKQYEEELDDLASLERFLKRTSRKVDSTVNDKKDLQEKQSHAKQERNNLKNKLVNEQTKLEYISEQVVTLET